MAEKGNETENLSRIKEILFGEDLTSIEERFENFRNEYLAAFEEIKDDFKNKVEKFEKLLTEKQKDTETRIIKTQERQDDFNEKVEQNIAEINLAIIKEKTETQEKIQSIETQNTIKLETLIKDINRSINELKDLQNNKFDELNNKKIDSKVISELFQLMADKLKD